MGARRKGKGTAHQVYEEEVIPVELMIGTLIMDLSGAFKMKAETTNQIKSNHSDTPCPQIPEKSMYVVFFWKVFSGTSRLFLG